jgi:hypothetical protein
MYVRGSGCEHTKARYLALLVLFIVVLVSVAQALCNSVHNERHGIILLLCHVVQACNGFAHSNGEVREASKELTVAVNACVTDSNGLVERHLSTLRPKQLEEYKDAFKSTTTSTNAAGATSSHAEHSSGSTAQASTHASSTRRRDSATGSAGATSSSKTTGDTPRGHKGGTPKGAAAKAGGGNGHSDAPPKRGAGGNAVDPPKTSPLLSPRTTGKPAGKTPRGGT